MLDRIRKTILALNVRAGEAEIFKDARRLTVLAAQLVKNPGKIDARLEGLASIMNLHETETGSWVPPDAMWQDGPDPKPFDACDLRHWLALSERAGVPFVPAREVLVLNEAEMSAASGQVRLPETAARRRVQAELEKRPDLLSGAPQSDAGVDGGDLYERLMTAMDDVPEGWMVRSNRCGPSTLKALAGFGAAGPEAPEVRFGADLEIGPGWVRRGNRRAIDAGDKRIVESCAQGPAEGACSFLARPWIEADRFFVGEDPHRHGTPFAGKGVWPAEWRVFVEDGQVKGVSFYYGWCGEANKENAIIALEAADLTQRIVDEAARISAFPRYMDIEFMRANRNPDILGNETIQGYLEDFGREKIACTLDFIETKDGLMLLEGGPANSPFGGGHPCAFAGCGGLPKLPNRTQTDGIAFRLMPQVILADPKTWIDGDRSGCVLDWGEVEALMRPRSVGLEP